MNEVKKRIEKINNNNPYVLSPLRIFSVYCKLHVLIQAGVIAIFVLASILVVHLIFVYTGLHFVSPDLNSTRYVFSAIAQSLAALVAISFTVLLISLQIFSTRFAIEPTTLLLSDWRTHTVVWLFLWTIIYSLFGLSKIHNNWMCSDYIKADVNTTLLLTTICVVFLVYFIFYAIINRSATRKVIDNLAKEIKDICSFSFYRLQRFLARKLIFSEKFSDRVTFEILLIDKGQQLRLPEGHVIDIDDDKISMLLDKAVKKVSRPVKLHLRVNFGSRIGPGLTDTYVMRDATPEMLEEANYMLTQAIKIDKYPPSLHYWHGYLESMVDYTCRRLIDHRIESARRATELLGALGEDYLKQREFFLKPFEQELAHYKGKAEAFGYEEFFDALLIGHRKIMKQAVIYKNEMIEAGRKMDYELKEDPTHYVLLNIHMFLNVTIDTDCMVYYKALIEWLNWHAWRTGARYEE